MKMVLNCVAYKCNNLHDKRSPIISHTKVELLIMISGCFNKPKALHGLNYSSFDP